MPTLAPWSRTSDGLFVLDCPDDVRMRHMETGLEVTFHSKDGMSLAGTVAGSPWMVVAVNGVRREKAPNPSD